MVFAHTKLLLCTLLIVVIPAQLLAYGVKTHESISDAAYQTALPRLQTAFFGAIGYGSDTRFSAHDADPQPPDILFSLTAKDWLKRGSNREDDFPRSLCHFFDPNHSGATVPFTGGFAVMTPARDWALTDPCDVHPHSQLALEAVELAFMDSTSEPINIPLSNLFTYPRAITHFLNGLVLTDKDSREIELALMFRSLGDVAHLLQDMAQPQHVRNDAHLDDARFSAFLQNPSVYERYVEDLVIRQALSSVVNLHGYPAPFPPAAGGTSTFNLPQDFFKKDGKGIAEFTNSNFVSDGTNCTRAATSCGEKGGYTSPPLNILQRFNQNFVDLFFHGSTADCLTYYHHFTDLGRANRICAARLTFFPNSFVDHAAIQPADQAVTNSRMTTVSIFDQDLVDRNQGLIFSLNHLNYDEQARILLPRAVGYSAGLLNYFFRGSMDVDISSSSLTIKNTSSFPMNGDFALYVEDANRNRSQVPGVSWTGLAIPAAPGSNTQTQTLTNPLPGGNYILVFHGTLGSTGEGVAGRAFAVSGDVTVSVNIGGTGIGSIVSSPPGINCGDGGTNCSATFPSGSTVMLTAASGAFSNWTGDCTGTSNPFSLASITSNKSCTATFVPVPSITTLSTSCTFASFNSNTLVATYSYLAQGTAASVQSPPVGFTPYIVFLPTSTGTFTENFTCPGWQGLTSPHSVTQCIPDTGSTVTTWTLSGNLTRQFSPVSTASAFQFSLNLLIERRNPLGPDFDTPILSRDVVMDCPAPTIP